MVNNIFPPYFSITNGKKEKSLVTYEQINQVLALNNIDRKFNYNKLSIVKKRCIDNIILDIIKSNFKDQITLYIPGKGFKSLSVTGNDCELHCEHCDIKYLNIMEDVSNQQKLRKTLDELIEKNYQGCLISGGCTIEGKVPIIKYKDVLKEYSEKSSLIFNFHTGLLNKDEIKALSEIKPDVISFDFTIDEEIIHDVYHLLDKNPHNYIETLELFKKYNLNVVPHITIGLNFGKTKKEIEALEFLKNYQFNLIVFIVLIPPKTNSNFKLTDVESIQNIMTRSRLLFPLTELSLGCMRPRGKIYSDIEIAAINSGFNRIVIPSKKSMKYIKKRGIKTQLIKACCAIPLNLYKFQQGE